MGLADLHRRGAETVAREHARHAGAGREAEHGQIASVGFADAGLGNADFNAGNRENFGLGGDLQVNGHDFVSINEQDGTAARWAARGESWLLSHRFAAGPGLPRRGPAGGARTRRRRSGQGWFAGAREDGALGPDPDRGHIQHAGLAVDRTARTAPSGACSTELPAATSVPPARRATRPREAENSRSPGWAPAARRPPDSTRCRRDRSCRPARSRAPAAPRNPAAGGGHPAAVPASAATAAPPPWARCLPCATASARPPVLSAGRARPGPPGSTCPVAPAAGPADCRWPDGSWRNGWPPSMTNSTRWPWAHSQPSWAWSRAISTDRVSGCRAVAA